MSPTESELQDALKAEGLSAHSWSNGPSDRYAAHVHSFNKVIYVVRGSITFGLPDLGQSLHLSAGDRLDLPAGTKHDAVVGPAGVYCLEAHR
jgi:quercetin dioxygenase-like cupin family protein